MTEESRPNMCIDAVSLLVRAPYLLVFFNPLILFFFARKWVGNDSKTARFISNMSISKGIVVFLSLSMLMCF